MSNVLVVAPHPDDETLGCGGTLLKHKANGDAIHWLIVTHAAESEGYSSAMIANREQQIADVSRLFNFDGVHNLKFPSARLDTLSRSKVVQAIGNVFHDVKPSVVYLPNRSDVHTDHRIVFQSAFSCTKWFRFPYLKRVLMYETISESEFGPVGDQPFMPNSFVDITNFYEKKVEIIKIYSTELGEHPFPRSLDSVRAQAVLRGAACGVEFAESFMILRELN